MRLQLLLQMLLQLFVQPLLQPLLRLFLQPLFQLLLALRPKVALWPIVAPLLLVALQVKVLRGWLHVPRPMIRSLPPIPLLSLCLALGVSHCRSLVRALDLLEGVAE